MQIIKTNKPDKALAENWLNFISVNKYFIILLFCLISGMLCGAVMVNRFSGDNAVLVNEWFNSFVSNRTQSGLLTIFFKIFLGCFIYIVIICISAFGLGGIPVCPILLFFRGFGTCMLSGLLYRNYSLQGIAFANLILLPSCVAIDFILVYFCSKGMKLSVNFSLVFRGSVVNAEALRLDSLVLLKRCVICVLLSVIAALFEAIFTVCFSGYFKLM